MVGLPPVLQARSDAQATRFGEIDRIGWAAECLDNDDDSSIRKILPPCLRKKSVVRLKEKTEEALADQPLVLQTKESILREEVRDLVESPLADETEERCSLKPNGDNSKHSTFNSKHGARSISSRFSQDAISTSVSSKQSLPSMYSAPVAQDEQSLSGHHDHRSFASQRKSSLLHALRKRVSDKSDASTVSSKCTVKSKLNKLSNSSKQARSDSNVSIKEDPDQQDATSVANKLSKCSDSSKQEDITMLERNEDASVSTELKALRLSEIEKLQINETTVGRLTFDEIMDIIIEADPETVNLLFRRPQKVTLQPRQGVPQKLQAAANKDEDATLQSKSTVGEDSYVPKRTRCNGPCGSRRNNPYEWESFLDMLIDSLCSDSNNACRDTFRRGDDDYPSDDASFGTEEDESYATYVTKLIPCRLG